MNARGALGIVLVVVLAAVGLLEVFAAGRVLLGWAFPGRLPEVMAAHFTRETTAGGAR